MRNLELPGRSVARSMNGMAATSHSLATLTAINTLQDGGNAMDAAVAACAVQGVVEPESTGIGGDCFVLCAPRGSSDIVAFNGSGRAPNAATAQWYADRGIEKLERFTPHSVTVPGSIDAWTQLLRDHGTRSLGDMLQPAIRFARDGYAITERVAADWEGEIEALTHDPVTSGIFLPNGKPPALGSVHSQPLLAASLEMIAEQGRDAFYKGAIAEDLVAHLRELGGLHSLEDFAAAAGEYVDPIKSGYKGYDIYQCPPNGQGVIALLLLNILSGYDLASMDAMGAERLHIEIEAMRLAYGARDAQLADPAQAEVPVEKLLSADYAAELRATIKLDRSAVPPAPAPIAAHADTVYLSVVDKDRNAVSFINSTFNSFGSGITGPKSGVVLQNRGGAFSVDPEHPNCIAPGKRPMHTIIPGMVAKGDRAVMPFGVMGGHYQAAGHARFLTNLLDYGLDIQQSMDMPRIFALPGEGESEVEAESGVPREVLSKLEDMGHRFCEPSKPIGGSQAIHIDWENGTLAGGSDPRKDGCALGY
ncbi:gamma-glutamyltransferase [Pelagibius litoralis]|uniref:Glutathione hydrolase proenzyme n=1 Tax=Pelagibius litoralis TaxID=374515 RepID=A0A967C700_9PROT|nr:gamma-glutamyltransferase [Pelagibius litoralis]NIA67507.1 gamma-glutamyltransferase [Pelagibius litoralis]